MAVVKGPALSIAASGNLGSICYSRWRGLQIARDVWTGTVPNTAKQIVQQALLKTCAQAWGGILNEEERESWRGLAREVTFRNRFGEPVHYSGYNLFVSRNLNRLRWARGISKKPGRVLNKLIWGSIHIEPEDAGSKIRFMATNFPVGYQADLIEAWIAGPYTSGGRVAIEPEYKFITYDTKVPLSIVKSGLTPGVYYWGRMRLGDFAGVTSAWETHHVFMQ